MEISKEHAQQSLSEVSEATDRTRKAMASVESGFILMLWGVICIAAYLTTYAVLRLDVPDYTIALIWYVLCGLGSVLSLVVGRRQIKKAWPRKYPTEKKIGWRIFWFWALLFIFIFVWLSILKPQSGIEMNAFMVTAVMFAYVVIGLWTEERYMLWLGLAVTAVTLIGFFLIPPAYYCLWMAPTAGGLLLGTGLYIYLKWR